MTLGFKDQFVPYVLDGSKTHTIRAGARWRPGMRADLFQRPRQKGMKLLFRAPVVRVEEITIEGGWETYSGDFFGDIHINGTRLDGDELELFAWRDGFRWRTSPCAHCCNWASCNTLEACRQIGYPKDAGCFARMMMFWRGRLPFHGQLIHWAFEERFTDVGETCYRITRAQAKLLIK